MRGDVSIQTVLILPAVLGLLWMAVHAALLFHAGHVASAAASVAARAAAAVDTPPASVVRRIAGETVTELGGHLVGQPQIFYEQEAVAVKVTVGGPTLVPFLPTTVTRRAVAPIEQFLLEQDR